MCRARIGLARGLQHRQQRIDQHHHAGTTAERSVVDPAVITLGVVARVPAVDRQQPALLRTPDDAVTGDLGHEFREQTDDIDAHGCFS